MADPALDGRLWDHYPPILRPASPPESLSPGLSGSSVWKADTNAGHVAVRRHPPTLYLPTLRHAHTQMTKARAFGWKEVPHPLPNNVGETFTKHDGVWWDVCTWQPGEPTKLPIDGPRLRAAVHFIARWHAFWTKANADFDPNHVDSDAFTRRVSEWRRLWLSDWAHPGLWDGDPGDPLGLSGRSARAVRARARRIEGQLRELPTLLAGEPKVLCHGDLHREHVLLTGGAVTGFIDLSCRWDYAAADLARWLSTTTEPNRWPQAFDWYREAAPLSAASERAVPLLAETGLVIAALRWEKWLFSAGPERRQFPRRDLAYDRWRKVVERLERGEV